MTTFKQLRKAHEGIEGGVLLGRDNMGKKVVPAEYYHAMVNCLFALPGIEERVD